MDYAKLTKKELLDVMNRLKHDIPIYREKDEKTKLKRAMKDRQKVRELFYECAFCLHAKVETTVDKNGKEADRIIELCNFVRCPYHKHFVNAATDQEDEITKALNKLLLT